MKRIILSQLFRLVGFGAASGLIYDEGYTYFISDDSNYLYTNNMVANTMELTYLADEKVASAGMIEKKLKKDFEAIAQKGDVLYVVGSGSKPNRQTGFVYNVVTKEQQKLELAALYSRMKEVAAIADNDFNIEGLVWSNNSWYFLNRGNGPGNRNIILEVKGDDWNTATITATDIILPDVNGVPAGFSDGVVDQQVLFFLATGEGTASTYNDGEITGTVVGAIDLLTKKVLSVQKISNHNKFEGITIYRKYKRGISFLLCEDQDDASTKSTLYRLDMRLKKRFLK